jgi:hypothetical protein
VAVEVVFEIHATTMDNEQGVPPAGCGASCLNRAGFRRGGHITAVFGSDLARAAQTASVAFGAAAGADRWL